MIQFHPQFFIQNVVLNQAQNPHSFKKSSQRAFLDFHFNPSIRLDESIINIQAASSMNFFSGSHSIANKDLLHLELPSSESDILASKDSRRGNSAEIISEILMGEGVSIETFKDFRKINVLENHQFTSTSPLTAIEYFLMDLLYTEKNLLIQEILTFVCYNPLSIQGNAAALQVFSQNGLEDLVGDNQIKKLFLQYYVKIKQGKNTIDLIGEYSVLKGVIEIVLVNYLSSKLNEERFKDFNEQYQEQNVVPELVYEVISDVFKLSNEKREEYVHALKFEQTRIVVTQEGDMFKAKLE